MFSTGRPGRLFLLVAILALAAWGQAPSLTTVSDVVYQADGSPAQGTVLISWPAFTTANGQAVGAGTTSVTLGAGGSLSVALVPTANSAPPTVYTVVYQLSNLVKTEYWSVPTTSPANLATVRTTLGASSAVSQMVTQQYVNSAVATKANDASVVHLSGSETITGAKQFSVAPSLPAPLQPTDGANKAYVDGAVQNLSGGSFISTSGGTMTGPLVLSGPPASSMQAADKQYVDTWAAVKADLIGGLVPPAELGSGTPGASTCLLGNQTWGACGAGGGGSAYINNIQVANPNFNASTPGAQSKFLNCSFQNAGSNVSLECPYGNTASSFAQGSQAVLNNQANTYSAGLQDFSAASLKLPSGPGYAPATGGAVGFDTTANMPVINVNGLPQQLALTTSNISGQASTALALAATPAQCNGAFATGIQANGNANCSTADIIQLAETTPPSGVANYGIFWFDSVTHTPRVIDNNGQVAQLGLVNAFNSDANTLEEYNGTNPQTLSVYGTRADAADYERIRLGYDGNPAEQYFFIASDAAGSGVQRGLGIWMQNSLRWVWDTSFNFKPWSDNLKDLGSSTLRLKHLYLGTYADLTAGAVVTEIANQASSGTVLNKLAKLTGSPATAVTATAADTNGVLGVVVDGAGTTGSAQIARDGQAACAFDGSTTAGDYVQISATIAGDCHDAGASYPGSGQVVGRVLSSNAGAGIYAMVISGAELQAGQAGGQITGSSSLGGTVTQTGTNAFGTSIAKVFVSAVADGLSGCAKINDVATNYVALPGQSLIVDLTGDQACGTAPIPASFANEIDVIGAATYHVYGTGQWLLPTKTRIFGNGATTNPPNGTKGFVIQACNNSTQAYCGGSSGSPNSFASNSPLVCLGSCSGSANLQAYDIQFWHGYIDCNYVSGCVAGMNYYAEEQSGFFFTTFAGWGNGGVGLDIGHATGTGAAGSGGNSMYEGLNLINTSPNLAACTPSAVGIRVNMGGIAAGGPKFIKGVTVVNTMCAQLSTPVYPNDDIQIAGADVALEDVHTETYGRAGVNVGVVTMGGSDQAIGAQSIKLDTINSSVVKAAGATDVIRLSSGATVAAIEVANVAAEAPNPATNTLNDQRNVVIPSSATARVAHYTTDQNGAVVADSSGVNAVHFSGGAIFGGSVTAPTPTAGDSSTKVATTAYVQGQTNGVPWLTIPRAGANSGVTFSTSVNQAYLWGVVLSFPVTTTQVSYYVGTADNTGNTYDIGIYNSSGTLLVHTGSKAGTTFAPATGAYTLAWTAGTTLQPGKYYLAITTSCTGSCAALAGDNASGVTFLSKAAVPVSMGGTLNGPITPPADAWNFASYVPAWAVR